MLSRTKVGNSVRDYFVTLRQFINYYKNHIADAIERMAKSGKYLYIILANKNKNIQKIGRTKNLRNRLHTYATGKETHPDIKFIMCVDDAESVENCVKTLMKKYRFKNSQELYKVDIDVLKSTLFNCAVMVKQIDQMNQMTQNNENLEAWVIYDEYEYLNADGETVGYEKTVKPSPKPKLVSKTKSKTKSKTMTKPKPKHPIKKMSKTKSKKQSR